MVFGLSSPNRFGAIICHRQNPITVAGKSREESGSQETMKGEKKNACEKFLASWFPDSNQSAKPFDHQ
jgi:hypothetical protein